MLCGVKTQPIILSTIAMFPLFDAFLMCIYGYVAFWGGWFSFGEVLE